jgi:hypothetical protein
LKKDRLIQKGGGNLGDIDQQLDFIIDENFKLQEEER